MNGLPTRSGLRDTRIDMFRGIALVMIFINHMPAQPWHGLTLRSWGFSDSAEVFVLLAGLASALAYGKWFEQGQFWQGVKAVFARIRTLYIVHLLLVVSVGAISVFAAEVLNETSYIEALGFDVLLNSPLRFVGHVLTLTFLPGYLDILPLYIVLLAGLPLMFWLARRHWALPLGLSFALWLAAQYLPINLPNTRTTREWFFNPAAWQLMFVIGFTIGQRMQKGLGLGVLGNALVSRSLTVIAVLFSLAAIVIAAPWREIPGYENVMLVNPGLVGAYFKTDLPLIRLADTLLKFWLVLVLIPKDAAWLRSAPARAMEKLGRHSLEVFAVSTVLAMAFGVAITVSGFHPGLIATSVLGGTALMLALAMVLEARARGRVARRATAAKPAPVAASPAPDASDSARALAQRTTTAPRAAPLAARLN